jgi:two-component system heavy metal sensor histidine kinase CusS
MSSKTAASRWSLAARLTLWYAASASALTGLVVATIYLALVAYQDSEIDAELTGEACYLHDHRGKALTEYSWTPVRVIDADGRVQFDSPQIAEAFPPEVFPPPEGGGTNRPGADGRAYRLLARRLDGWTYQLAHDRTPEQSLLIRFRGYLPWALVPTLAVSLAGGYWLARRGIRPVLAIAATARGVSPSQLSSRVPTEKLPAELLELADTFNAMLARLQAAFARLDQFSADVAHELRTPVHNLRAGVEVALGQDRSPEEYRRLLPGVLAETERLSRLIDRLLFLARAEDPRRDLRRERTDVAAELAAVREFFEPSAAEAGVALHVAAPEGLSFPLDRALFQRAISNLVSNALAHTPDGGRVRLTAETTDGGLRVTVADTGRGIPPDDLPHLFDRFYRSRAARTAGQGVGLGLAIVRRVAELHGGAVTIESELRRGTTVSMTFARPVREDSGSFDGPPRRQAGEAR